MERDNVERLETWYSGGRGEP